MNPSIQTTHGTRLFDLMEPRAEDVDSNDIIHSLSLLCRFNGHTRKFYSVAQHSCLVYQAMWAEFNGSPRDQLFALLHDAHEAYTGDITRPMACFLPELAARKAAIQDKIHLAFGLPKAPPPVTADIIRRIDERVLFTERRDLFPIWVDWGYDVEPYEEKIEPWPSTTAANLFLNIFTRLMNGEWGGAV